MSSTQEVAQAGQSDSQPGRRLTAVAGAWVIVVALLLVPLVVTQ
jgi:hypothetical protein